MRFVLDENLPPRLAAWLIEQGHEAAHVRDLGLRSSPDRLIRDGSGPARSVIVSKDRDFVRIQRPQDGQVLHLTCGT